MKRLKPIAVGLALTTGLGVGTLSLPQNGWAQDDEDVVVKLRVPRAKPDNTEDAPKAAKTEPEASEAADEAEQEVAQAEPTESDETESDETESEDTESEADDTDTDSDASSTSEEEEKTMSDDKTTQRTPEEQEIFKQTMHEGDIALGVCGARVSALLWFYEASVAQGRDDLKPAVASLTETREAIKAEAERRAVNDKVDTSARVMNSESEKIWDDLNEKAGGDEKEFQKAHDELFSGVQECLALFFDRPEAEGEAAKE